MLIPLDFLVKKYNIVFTGILHVGAHECEEIVEYEKYISRDKVLWVDALQDKVELSKSRFPDILIEQAVVSDCIETVKFNRSNNGQSSSFLEFGLHKQYPEWVHYVESFEVETKMLKDIICKYDIAYNFLNLDIQGVELKALKGMEEYLSKVDYIYTEVNDDYVYEGCSLIGEIDDYLKQFGFIRAETCFTDCKWGDAFYIKMPHYKVPISLCITTMNRFDDFLSNYLDKYLSFLKRGIIQEIVVLDDASDDYNKINEKYKDHINTHSNFVVKRNEENVGVFLNKIKVCEYSSNTLVALIDSDNFCDENYFITAKKYVYDKQALLTSNYVLAPYFAKPNFNYKHLVGVVNIQNIKNYKNIHSFEILMNTGNYVLTKNMVSKLTYDESILNTVSAADVIYMNTLLFSQVPDFEMHILEGLEYDHIIHNGSEYLTKIGHCSHTINNIVNPLYQNL